VAFNAVQWPGFLYPGLQEQGADAELDDVMLPEPYPANLSRSVSDNQQQLNIITMYLQRPAFARIPVQ
jgi:hypothetical protein